MKTPTAKPECYRATAIELNDVPGLSVRQPIVTPGFASRVVVPDTDHRPIERSDPAETHPVGFVAQLVPVPAVV